MHDSRKFVSRPRSDRNSEFPVNGMVEVRDPYFFGSAYVSQNKRWVVGIRDSDGEGQSGHRNSGNGKAILIDWHADRVLWVLESFARPFDAAVANTGECLIHDTGFGSTLQADVVALNQTCHERFRRHYEANVYSVGISPCGRYGVVQTASAPTSDGNLLEAFDLKASTVLFSVRPSVWTNKYSFDVGPDGLEQLWVYVRKLGRFAYSSTGEFVDNKKYQTSLLENGDYGSSLLAAQDLLKSARTSDHAAAALRAAERALALGAAENRGWAAIAHRVRGESLEIQGHFAAALDAYDLALECNPKVGVQRKADSLRRRISIS